MDQESFSSHFDRAVAPLVFALVAGNSIVLALIHARTAPSEILQAALAAFVSSEGSLAAIWIGFGNRPLPVRLAMAVPAIAAIFIPFFIEERSPEVAMAVAAALLVVVVVAIPSLVMRMAGWRLVRFAAVADAENWRSDQNTAQFTLRQMFSWTLAVAMVAGLARVVARSEDFRPGMLVQLLVTAGVCLACGAVAYGAVWAALGRKNPAGRLIMLAAAAALLAGAVLSLLSVPFGAPGEALIMFMIWAALNAMMTGCGLLSFRAIGFRLVRASRGERTTKNAG